MATNYPGALDTTTELPNAEIDAAPPTEPGTRVLAFHNNNKSDALIAIETKLGIDSSAVITTVDFKLQDIVSGEKAISPSSTAGLTNKTGAISQWTNDVGYSVGTPPASSVTIVDVGAFYGAGDVEGALQEAGTKNAAHDAHVADVTTNPHAVTASQVNALADGSATVKESNIDFGSGANQVDGASIPLDVSGFSGNLSAADIDVQLAMDTLDAVIAESTTASNVNVGGVGVFKQEVSNDLEFRGINAASSKITVVLDAGNNEIDIDAVEANFSHLNIGDIGTNSHAAIDTHIADATIHFTEASIDHTAITNIGTNSHAQIDTHLALVNEHIDWTAASVDLNTTADIGAGVADNDASAILEAASTTQGFLPPRMTTTQRDAVSSPADGLLIFNTTTGLLEIFNSGWGSV